MYGGQHLRGIYLRSYTDDCDSTFLQQTRFSLRITLTEHTPEYNTVLQYKDFR